MWNCHVWKLHRFSVSDPRNQRHCKSLQDSTEKHLSRNTATLVFPSLSQKNKTEYQVKLKYKMHTHSCNVAYSLHYVIHFKGAMTQTPNIFFCSFQWKINVDAILCRYRYKKWVVKKCFRVKRALNAAICKSPPITGDCHFALAPVTSRAPRRSAIGLEPVSAPTNRLVSVPNWMDLMCLNLKSKWLWNNLVDQITDAHKASCLLRHGLRVYQCCPSLRPLVFF